MNTKNTGPIILGEITAREVAQAIVNSYGTHAKPLIPALRKLLGETNAPAEPEPKPCPWCGGHRILRDVDVVTVWWECVECTWHSQTYRTREEALNG